MMGSPAQPQNPLDAPRHVLVLDTSKSMLAPISGAPRKKIEVAREAVGKILEEVANQRAFFGMVVFNSTTRVLFPLSQKLPSMAEIVQNTQPTGKSAIWDALALGADLLRMGPGGPIVGNLVLVTDGWDNMSRYFRVGPELPQSPVQRGSRDLIEYMVRGDTALRLQVIGIGSGAEKDKGVDAAMMQTLLATFSDHADQVSSNSKASYREVMTGEELYTRMINAFLDVPFEDSGQFSALSSEDLAKHAADVAQALRNTSQYGLVEHLSTAKKSDAESAHADQAGDFDVAVAQDGNISPEMRDRFGPLGEVASAFMAKDWARAEATLQRNAAVIHPFTRSYWMARISYAKGDGAEAARYLTEAWIEAATLPAQERPRMYRRLALLHAKVGGDRQVQSLVEIFERAHAKVGDQNPSLRDHLETMFEKILDLKRTYASIRSGGAMAHETLVEEIFGLLQDARIEDTHRDPDVQAFLSFVEVALSEMR